jgi:CyaY protein
VLSEQDFRLKADEALERLQRTLMPLAEQEDFEVELQDGVVEIVFDEPAPATFVVSPNAPMRQIWVSAMSRGYKLSWSEPTSRFEIDGEPLDALVERLTRQFLTA